MIGSKLADEVAVTVSSVTSKQVRFANNEIAVTKCWEETSTNILFKKDKRILINSTTDVSKKSLQQILHELARMAKLVKPHPCYAELPKETFKYKTIPRIFDPTVLKLEEELVERVTQAIDAALQAGAERVAGSLVSSYAKTLLATSLGIETSYEATNLALEVRALSNKEASGLGTSCGTSLKDLNAEKAGEEAGKLAKKSIQVKAGKAGRYDVVLGRPAAAVLLEWTGGMCSAFDVDAGFSCFADKIGERVASAKVNFYDDGTVAGGLASRPFDDEGYPVRRNVLIKNGILRNYLHNSLTAKKHGTKTTANAGWIVPKPWNLMLEPGKETDEELMGQLENGLYVHNLGYVRFHDYRKGDFSAVLRDGIFEVRNGEVVKAVKGLRLSENLINMLKNIENLSKSAVQTFHWWMESKIPVSTPLILIRKVNFTTAH
jgi:PmbA protein